MDKESVHNIIEATFWPRMMAAVALGTLAVFLLISTLSVWKSYTFIGSGVTATNTIAVSGTGDVYAVPDTAEFTATVQETDKDVKTAQATATKKANDIIAYLKGQKIDEKDIKTTDYSVSPQYEWQQASCKLGEMCPPGKQVLTGYQVSQTLTIKVRDTAKAGDLLAGVGTRGVSQVSGLNFTIDDEDALKAEARTKAIAQASDKAKALADSLHVKVVRIVGFNESEGPSPIVFSRAMAGKGMVMDAAVAPSPEVPTGQNKITSNVTITYEIQ